MSPISFDDVLPATSWSLTDLSTTESGAICLIYDRLSKAGELPSEGEST
ncbi:hypothetical protein [Nonomuraea africana]|uniref:Uncharacterized protein n=1 Tax=Nonomuraea africana TaxID=46171 RepID=A0ABR9KV40_9ACTN|nr:hypothetical protein [Nonomuraea africana]MBE1565906.1 hypothetical protein [Nonomuraea africana]